MSASSEAEETFEPPRKRLSLTRHKKLTDFIGTTDGRLAFNSSPEVNKYKEKMVPKTTLRATKWALSIFEQWLKARESLGHKLPPSNVLCSPDSELVCEWLCRFFTEVCKSDGSHYCPRSLSSILAGLQRHIQTTSSHSLKIQDQEGEFKPLHVLLENLYKELHEQGVGAVKAQARIITFEEEARLLVPSVLATLRVFSMQYFI